MALVDIHHSDATSRIATSRNLVVYVWRDAPTVAQMREAGRVSRAHTRKHPDGTGLLDLILDGTPRFSEELRAEATKVTGDPTLASLGAADVVLVGGLAGVAVRGFLSTVMLLGRAVRPYKVFGDVPAAAAWLAPKLSVGSHRWTPADLEAIAAELTAKAPSPRAP